MKSLVTIICAFACACATESADDEDVLASESEYSVPSDFMGGRIALARFYQHANATIPKSDIPRRIEQLEAVHPTWVSGLVRLDPDDTFGDEHVAAYKAVHDAMPNARLDVVLNAEHYQGPSGWDRLKKRMQSVDDAFRTAGLGKPDAFFFDYYSKGQVDVMEKATAFTKQNGQKMGGTFWATSGVPKGTDFVVVDDHDGLDRMVRQSQQLRANYKNQLAVLAHVENNPSSGPTGDDKKNLGIEWVTGRLDPKVYIQEQAGKQKAGGFLLMFPVAFPLSKDFAAWDPDQSKGYLGLVDGLMK